MNTYLRIFFILNLFIIFLFGSNSFAQNTFKEGYYVNLEQDTIHGYIRDDDWRLSPKYFLFKPSTEANIEKIFPQQVLSFQILNTDYYIAKTLSVEVSPVNINKLNKDSNFKFEEKSIFLRTLLTGQANLYKYSEADFVRFFLEHHGELEQLIYKQYLNESNEIASINYFRNQLFTALKCDQLQVEKFENITYREKPIIKVVKLYNSCFEVEQQEFKKIPKFEIKLKLRPGAQLGFLKVNSPGRDTDDFGSQLAFRIGLELEYILPYNNNKWSIIFEPAFQSYSSRVDYLSFVTPRFREVEYSSIELAFGLRHYFFLNDIEKIFINLGGVADYPFSSSVSGNVGGNLDFSRSANAYFGAGYALSNKIDFELRWQFNRDLVQSYSRHSSSFNSLALIFAYQLF